MLIDNAIYQVDRAQKRKLSVWAEEKRSGTAVQAQKQLRESQVGIIEGSLNRLTISHVYINSLLPVGRYIDIDPSPTTLVISQTQFISFGQSLFWLNL